VALFRLTSNPVSIRVEAIVVFPDDSDRPRVIRAVTTAAFTVVVGGIRVETGAGIVRVAFARFFFFHSCFFDSRLFSFFGSQLSNFGAMPAPSDQSRALTLTASNHPRVATHRHTMLAHLLSLVRVPSVTRARVFPSATT
jgi:hypothetical protein